VKLPGAFLDSRLRRVPAAFGVAAALSAASLGFGDSAWAQQSPPPAAPVAPSREQLNPRQRAPEPPKSRDLFTAPAAGPCPFADSKLTFQLQSVTVEGSTIAPARMKPAYGDLIGSTIPVAKICEIRDRLSLILFRQGLLAQVVIPPQTIKAGALKLSVVEARIVAVNVHGDIGPAQAQVQAYLAKLRGLTPFDLRTAQRYLLLANETPGVRVTATLKPSPQGPGALDLEVTLARTPYNAAAAVQNNGSKAEGPWSALARVDLNSFTRFGERTSLILYRTVPQNEQWVVQLVEEARLGASGLLGRASVAYGQSRPGDVLKPLDLRDTSLVVTPELDYPIVKLRRGTLNAVAGLDVVDQKTEFTGGGLLADDKLRVVWTGLGAQYQTPLPGHRLVASGVAQLQLRKGLSGLGASQAGAPDLSRPFGHPDAFVVRLTADNQLAGRLGAVGLRVQAQYANKPLLSYEEMTVGDLTIGRGYDPAAVSGDRVVGAELKLSPPELRFDDAWGATPFVFGDASAVENLDPGSDNRTLRSAGVGVDVRMPYGLRANLTWAHPFDKPFAIQPKTPDDRVLFQLVAVH
jgi:hemolysin activation/secretion protein